MVVYRAQYKCRSCGKTFHSAVSGGLKPVMACIRNMCFDIPIADVSTDVMKPTLLDYHTCANGDIGLADFISWSKEEE